MRVFVAMLAIAALTACAPEEQAPNRLLSCSVALPQDWRDALTAHEVKSDARVIAASEDGRTAILLTSPPANELTLLSDDGQRRSIVSSQDYIYPGVELIGHTVKYAIQAPHREPAFYLWDARTGGPPTPADGQLPFKAFDRATDGTTTAWQGQNHAGQLYVRRTGWPEPRMIAAIEVDDTMGFVLHPSVHGDFVSWSWVASYVTDIRTGATVHLGSRDYRLEVLNGALIRSGGGIASFTPLSALSPLPAC
jgi:hypothetical protein